MRKFSLADKRLNDVETWQEAIILLEIIGQVSAIAWQPRHGSGSGHEIAQAAADVCRIPSGSADADAEALGEPLALELALAIALALAVALALALAKPLPLEELPDPPPWPLPPEPAPPHAPALASPHAKTGRPRK